MIKTLVSIEVDLISSLALRFACQMGGLTDMEIQPVYVKESPTHESSWGAGWASRTWEKEMVEEGQAEVAELITAEMDFCPLLREPRVIYGDKDVELMKIMQSDQYDFFVEGAHFTWTAADLHKKFQTKLYRKIPSAVVLVKALRKITQVSLICLDVESARALTQLFQRVWKDMPVPLHLYFAGSGSDKFVEALRMEVAKSAETLQAAGCTVHVHDDLPPVPTDGIAQFLDKSGLVAMAMDRDVTKDSPALRWLANIKSAALLAFR